MGARTVRQGTGPYLAAALHQHGAAVTGVVGTRSDTVAEAVAALEASSGILTRGYDDLGIALTTEQPDLVVICSPWQVHEEQLNRVADHRCHCLVEKPMLWPASETAAASLIERFESAGLLLEMVAQWPFALPSFEALYGTLPTRIETFEMRLSPMSIGPHMVPDAAPHFLALLHALAGNGSCQDIRFSRSSESQLSITCQFENERGAVDATLLLETVATRPRPAWITINGQRAERAITLPEYHQRLVSGEASQPLPDPMSEVAGSYLQKLRSGAKTDCLLLNSLHGNLCRMSRAWPD